MDIEINKRDDNGEIIDVDLPKKMTDTELAKETEALTPDKPLPDLRVERFLMEIAENAVTGTEKIFNVYKAAQEDDMYIVDRKKSGNFISIYKNIMFG